MAVFFVTGDLMFSSQVDAAARRLQIELRVVPSAAGLATTLGEADDVALVLVDLSLPAIDPADLVAQIRAAAPEAAVVAYAPHVHENKLAAARQADCDEVLSRGQFNSQIDRILRRYAVKAG